MSHQTSRKLFILGCERSGSTWLSNIFDSHPNVELFMEPFADYAGIFPAFPERNLYLSGPDAELVDIVRTRYENLYCLKYPLFYKRNRPLFFKRFDKFLVDQYQRLARLFELQVLRIIDQYTLLNLNTSAMPINEQFKKELKASLEVTKELRLNFKIGVLASAFPDASYVICMRDPGAQISSILRLFSKGSLGELKNSLASFLDCVRDLNRFEKYRVLIDRSERVNDIEVRLVLWWIMNYEVLIQDLKSRDLDFEIVYHEEISEHPDEIVSQLFKFCQLDFGEQTRSYLRLSSTRDNNDASPVNTVRDSRRFYRRMIKAVDPNLQRKTQHVFEQSDIIPEISSRYGYS